MRRTFKLVALAFSLTYVTGCASLTVTKVTAANDMDVQGVRYYLPKPFIVVAPQADGTVSAKVVYLPDKSHEYAIDSSSTLSSYAFQASTDPEGLLTTVQYNANSTAVPVQAAASTGAGIAAALNYQAAEAGAIQTQVNTAQTAVITAQSDYSAALAALNSDQQTNAGATQLQQDASLVAQKQAALQVAQAALKSAQSTPQVVASLGAAAGTPVAETPASPGTPLGAPQWSAGPTLSLPDRYGPVWFAVDDTVSDKGESVRLTAVTSAFPESVVANSKSPQPIFQTTLTALGPPRIPVPTAPFSLASKLPAVFMFSRAVEHLTAAEVRAANSKLTLEKRSKPFWDGDRTITVDISGLKPGAYWLNVIYQYAIEPAHPEDLLSAHQKFIFYVVAK